MSLRDSAVKGVLWTGVGTVGAGMLNFILTMILARVLTPNDYGLLELLAIFTVLSECFIDSGFSQAVIKDQKASQTDLSSVFFFNLGIALILYVILFLCAPVIARFYREPSLVWLSRYVFLVIIFYSCSIIQNANFARNLQFKPQAVASVVSIIVAGTVAGIMAFKGCGVWALATNMVLFAFLKMIFFWLLSSWKPSLTLSVASIKKYFKFGVNLLIQGLIDKFVTNLESLMIGRVYTKTELGYFSQARKLDSYICSTSQSVIQKVTYPILAKIGDDDNRLKQGYKRVLGLTMFIIGPILTFTLASADKFLFCVFGRQWIPSTPFLRLWCLCGICVTFYSIFINIFLVKNKTRVLLKLSIVKQIIRIIFIVALIRVSVLFLMYGIAIATLFATILYCYYGGRLISYKLHEIVVDLLPTIIACFISGVAVYAIPFLVTSFNHYFCFVLQLITMCITYFAVNYISKSAAFLEFKDIVKSLR